jgi:hypothetical protein
LTHDPAGLPVRVHTDAELAGRVAYRKVRHLGELGRGEPQRATAEASPLPPSPSQAGLGSLDETGALELPQGSHEVELQPAGRRREVEAFLETDERHAAFMQFLYGRHHMRERSAESVKRPDADDIHSPAARVHHQPIERRPTILGAGYALVLKLANERPLMGGDVGLQLEELVIDGLGVGTDTAISRGTHDGRPLRSGLP